MARENVSTQMGTPMKEHGRVADTTATESTENQMGALHLMDNGLMANLFYKICNLINSNYEN